MDVRVHILAIDQNSTHLLDYHSWKVTLGRRYLGTWTALRRHEIL